MKIWIARLLFFVAVSAAFLFLSRLPIHLNYAGDSELLFTFRNAPKSDVKCRPATPEEKARMLPHMRREEICDRARPSTRVQVLVNGAPRLDKTFLPLGLSSDLMSIGMESIPVDPGTHQIDIEVRDTETHTFSRSLPFQKDSRTLVEFLPEKGFIVTHARPR
jgi:hypothetical protein